MGKSSTKAQNKYISKTYDRINLTVDKGFKEVIKEHAEQYDGGSVNGFINRAIKEAMERDTASANITNKIEQILAEQDATEK